MRTLILALLIFPMVGIGQTFIKLTDASGQQIKGDATTRGFERSLIVLAFTSSGKNSSQLSFNTNVSGASADLKKAAGNGTLLPTAILTVTQPGGGGNITISYTIKLENIRVNSCTEALGCDGVINTTTVITASRIGWTYYQTDNTGKTSVSRKYGFDNETGREWVNF